MKLAHTQVEVPENHGSMWEIRVQKEEVNRREKKISSNGLSSLRNLPGDPSFALTLSEFALAH